MASDLNLERLHDVVQIAMGWTNSHLHCFRMPSPPKGDMRPFLTEFDVIEGETDGIHERDVRFAWPTAAQLTGI